MDFRLTPRTPRIPCPGCRPEILRRVQGFKKAQNHTPGNKAPPVWPCFYQRQKQPLCGVGARSFGTVDTRQHSPTAQSGAGAQRGRGGATAWQRKKIPKETPEVNTMVAWTRASPPKPITSRHRVVFSPLYLFTDKGAPRNHARCAFVLEREGLPPPRPRRRYYPARRMMRGEEGPKVFRLKTKKNLAFRYANPIQTPHRR